MKKEDFIQLIKKMNDNHKKTIQLYNLGINAYDYTDDYYDCIHILISSIYNADACDFIYWFIYEKFEGDEPLQAFDENNVEIIKDVDGLYNYCEDNKL